MRRGSTGHVTFHLGGGEGGIEHMLAQFKPAFESWWATMSTPTLDDATCQRIIGGVNAEAHGRSIAELAAERDAILLPLLELVGRRGGSAQTATPPLFHKRLINVRIILTLCALARGIDP